jgi:hypothetical protein
MAIVLSFGRQSPDPLALLYLLGPGDKVVEATSVDHPQLVWSDIHLVYVDWGQADIESVVELLNCNRRAVSYDLIARIGSYYCLLRHLPGKRGGTRLHWDEELALMLLEACLACKTEQNLSVLLGETLFWVMRSIDSRGLQPGFFDQLAPHDPPRPQRSINDVRPL